MAANPVPTNKIPLPHFLNLPLPTIPIYPQSQSNIKLPNPPSGSSPLIFKLTLSADQFAELVRMDAEVEEGEEGGVRVEFESGGKGQLHLSPTSVLPLAPPRSGPPRLNKPEEIYQHSQQPGPGRQPLSGLIRIPTGTPTFEVVLPPPPPPPPPIITAPPSEPIPTRPVVPTPVTSSEQHQKERLAGQRLKEKRLEEERKKKEKQMVVLEDAPVIPATAKKGRPKGKAATTKAVTERAKVKAVASKATKAASKSTSKATPVPAALPVRRALPGSQTGKQLASEHNSLYHTSSTPIVIPAPPPAPLPPAPVPAPSPPTTYKRSSSNKRGKKTSSASDETTTTNGQADSSTAITKLSASTALSSLSEESDDPVRNLNKPADASVAVKPLASSVSTEESDAQPLARKTKPASKVNGTGVAKLTGSSLSEESDALVTRKLKTPAPSTVANLAATASCLSEESDPRPPTSTITNNNARKSKPTRPGSGTPIVPLPNKQKTGSIGPTTKKNALSSDAGLSKAPSPAPTNQKKKTAYKSSATVESDEGDEEEEEAEVIVGPTKKRKIVGDGERVVKHQRTNGTKERSSPMVKGVKANPAPVAASVDETRAKISRPSTVVLKKVSVVEKTPTIEKPTAAENVAAAERVRSPSLVVPAAASQSSQPNGGMLGKKKRPAEDTNGTAPSPSAAGVTVTQEAKRVKPTLPTIKKIKPAAGAGVNGTSENDGSQHHQPVVKKKKKKRQVDFTSSEEEIPIAVPPAATPAVVAPSAPTASVPAAPVTVPKLERTRLPGEVVLPSFKRHTTQQSIPPPPPRLIEDRRQPDDRSDRSYHERPYGSRYPDDRPPSRQTLERPPSRQTDDRDRYQTRYHDERGRYDRATSRTPQDRDRDRDRAPSRQPDSRGFDDRSPLRQNDSRGFDDRPPSRQNPRPSPSRDDRYLRPYDDRPPNRHPDERYLRVSEDRDRASSRQPEDRYHYNNSRERERGNSRQPEEKYHSHHSTDRSISKPDEDHYTNLSRSITTTTTTIDKTNLTNEPPPNFRRISVPSLSSSESDQPDNSNQERSYERLRLKHFRLNAHYGFITNKLENFKMIINQNHYNYDQNQNNKSSLNLNDIKELIKERLGLENELEILRGSLISFSNKQNNNHNNHNHHHHTNVIT
ncbi:hypothetical protein CROQUDRAFT_659241 [Cronartium quercuum f. sp. fusiforme G11]|uniref:Uncharacterized protein n=1 Tax=Cronartium quercuum f. sp. fusiforme G11 TaxID=708437 RepID=A0A9P6TAW1_9BASI|nr:hypothetical protein CROQUDRAFT_659241 [Cronartium quercuum f. sp. fusiforme G11]